MIVPDDDALFEAPNGFQIMQSDEAALAADHGDNSEVLGPEGLRFLVVRDDGKRFWWRPPAVWPGEAAPGTVFLDST